MAAVSLPPLGWTQKVLGPAKAAAGTTSSRPSTARVRTMSFLMVPSASGEKEATVGGRVHRPGRDEAGASLHDRALVGREPG